MRRTFLGCSLAFVSQLLWANAEFDEARLSLIPPQPADHSTPFISCPVTSTERQDYLDSAQTQYQQAGWEQRISLARDFFPAQDDSRILMIDVAQREGKPVYRYLSDGTEDQLYEPWSSSKIMAFTAALSRLRRDTSASPVIVGQVALGDLITSINSYASSGLADGDSNAIATYFLNVAGRDEATALLHDSWLKLANSAVRFRGAYGGVAFAPEPNVWMAGGQPYGLSAYQQSSDDPGFQPYRCDTCGLTGNKPQTTLAQAEGLRRLAMFDDEPNTRPPGLTRADILTLLYGDKPNLDGGMMAGISQLIHSGLAAHLPSEGDAKSKLDAVAPGWRVWQKIGWGPSETRGAGEMVMIAHICLPAYQGGRAVTLAAQASYPDATDASVYQAAGILQRRLDDALGVWLRIEH